MYSHVSVRKLFVLLMSILLIAACSGGNNNPPPPPAKDTRPNAFTFTAQADATLSTQYSASATISGINSPATISITGGEYSVAGGDFTAAGGTISNGQTLAVRATSSDQFATDTTVTVTVGGVSASFVITTEAEDTTPDALVFTAVTDAALSSVQTSNTVTVQGINSTSPVSIQNGEYAIDGGAYTTAAGTVTNGQTVTLRQTSAASLVTETIATLTIGGVAGQFSVTTFADTTAPTVTIDFPTKTSVSNAPTAWIRGRAEDDYSTVSAITVNGVAVTTTDNFATWTAEVNLTVSQANTITVTSQDSEGNTNTQAAEISVLQGSIENAFPNDQIDFDGGAMAYDAANERLIVRDYSHTSLLALDIHTSEQTVLSGPATPNTDNAFSAIKDIVVDQANNRALILDSTLLSIIAVDLTTGARTLLSTPTQPDPINKFVTPVALELDVDRNRLYITDQGLDAIIWMNLDTGGRTVLSSLLVPNADNQITDPEFMSIDNSEGVMYVSANEMQKKIYKVDLASGVRSEFVTLLGLGIDGRPLSLEKGGAGNNLFLYSDSQLEISYLSSDGATATVLTSPSIPDAYNHSGTIWDVPRGTALDNERRVIFVSDWDTVSGGIIYVVDLDTGRRSVMADSFSIRD